MKRKHTQLGGFVVEDLAVGGKVVQPWMGGGEKVMRVEGCFRQVGIGLRGSGRE